MLINVQESQRQDIPVLVWFGLNLGIQVNEEIIFQGCSISFDWNAAHRLTSRLLRARIYHSFIKLFSLRGLVD